MAAATSLSLSPCPVSRILKTTSPKSGSADVLHVFDVTLVAERAEPFIDHHFGEADDGVERRADLVADPRQHVRLGARRAIGQPPRLSQFALAFPGLR